MSDDKITKKRSDPYGRDCPAAQPMCPCGARGCARAAEHARTMAPVSTRRWRWRR